MNIIPLSLKPRLFLIQDALTLSMCEALKSAVTDQLRSARVYKAGGSMGGIVNPDRRTGDICFLQSWHQAARPFVQMAAFFSGLTPSHSEPVQVGRYRPGEFYRRHHDTYRGPALAEAEVSGGQRTWSALAYLNTVADGGETYFDRLGIKVRPVAGNVIVWENVDAEGRIDPGAYHSAEPPASEEKWSAAAWFRARPWVHPAQRQQLAIESKLESSVLGTG